MNLLLRKQQKAGRKHHWLSSASFYQSFNRPNSSSLNFDYFLSELLSVAVNGNEIDPRL